MNSNEISNYSTQEQPFSGAAWLVLNILLKHVLLLSSVSVYVACENGLFGDKSMQPVHVCLLSVIQISASAAPGRSGRVMHVSQQGCVIRLRFFPHSDSYYYVYN